MIVMINKKAFVFWVGVWDMGVKQWEGEAWGRERENCDYTQFLIR